MIARRDSVESTQINSQLGYSQIAPESKNTKTDHTNKSHFGNCFFDIDDKGKPLSDRKLCTGQKI